MIAVRKIVQIPASSRRGLSFLATNLEFPHTSAKPTVPSAPKFNSLTLEDGVRIASRETSSGVVSFKVAVMGGSGAETAAQFGSAQLISSAAFTGEDGLTTVRDLENFGARLTTSCDREKITFDVSVIADHAESVLALLLGFIAKPSFKAYSIEEIKGAAKLHYDRHAQCADSQLRELLFQAGYGETSALGHSIFAQNLKKLSGEQVLNYYGANFVRKNLVVTSSGGISADKVRAVVQSSLAGVANGSSASQANSHFVGGDARVRAELNSAGDKTAIAAAFETPSGEEAKAFVVLGGVLNARGGAVCTQGGLFSMYAKGVAGAASEKMHKMLGDLINVGGGNVPELNAVKAKLSTERLVAAEGTGATCYLLKSVLTGVPVAKLADVRDVSAQQVSAAAQSLLKKAPAVAVYGATAGTPNAASLQKLLA